MGNSIQEMKLLIKKLNFYSDAYYNRQPVISDKEFDRLYDELEKMEKETGIVLHNSPTRVVGFEVVSKLGKVKHNKKLLSLSKTKSTSDIFSKFKDLECVTSLKLDGLTTKIEYRKGKLYKASTRGNGLIGEDISHCVKSYRNIPLTLNSPIDITVVGESIIKLGDFTHFNSRLKEEDQFKNPRNAVSGTVRNLDSKVAKDRRVRFIAFDISEIEDHNMPNTYSDTLVFLSQLGFNTVPNVSGYGDVIFEQLKQYAKLTGFGIDGCVIRVDDNSLYESMGQTSKFPHGAIAFKFDDEVQETTLLRIDWSIGRTGVLTPVAIFEPVELDGSTVERASLHNIQQIENLNLGGKGSIIEVQKSNQIIPQLVSVVERKGDFEIPSNCPFCGEPTQVKEDGSSKILLCSNHECEERLVMNLQHYVSRDAMNIEGLSEQNLRLFVKHGLVSSAIDIYNLKDHKSYLLSLEGFGHKSVNSLIENIEKSREVTLDRFIYALGINDIGLVTARKIIEKINSIDKLMKTPLEAFKELVGDVKGASFYNYIKRNTVYLMLLVNQIKIIENKTTEGALYGKSFCITGSCVEFKNRREIKNFILSNGGKVTDSVTTNTDYLIANDVEDSSKYKKAKKLNTTIISDKELKLLI